MRGDIRPLSTVARPARARPSWAAWMVALALLSGGGGHAPAAPAQGLPESVRPASSTSRELASQLSLRYRVQYGEDGFTLGRSTYTWQVRDGRYALSSVAEATGLAALLTSGRIVQHSEGRIGPAGLQPERYSIQRSPRRKDTARFDWDRGLLRQDSQQGDQPLPEATQDMLGFPFHLALTVPPATAEFTLPVTNGRTLKEYSFRDLGLEQVKAAGGLVRARHLRGTRPGEGALDVWLDSRGQRLPVMIRTLDDKGKVMTLIAEAMPGEASAH